MRLLLFGLFKPQEPQQSLRDSLKEISDEYNEHSFAASPGRSEMDFKRLMRDYKPDVVFMQVQSPGIITGRLLKKYPGIKFFNFSGDVREQIPSWYFEVAPYCTTLFTNTDWVEAMKAKGHKARYFQVGFSHDIYKPEGPKEETKPVVFMGNNYGSKFPLSKLRAEMIERFTGKEWFECYGRGWGPGVKDLSCAQEQEAAVYRGAKIGINLSHLDLGSYTSDRMFRIMGSGCMCLAYRHKDIEKEFEDGDSVVIWKTLEELEVLIEHTLNVYTGQHYNKIIANVGCNLVHEKYTWPARMKADLIPLLYELAT